MLDRGGPFLLSLLLSKQSDIFMHEGRSRSCAKNGANDDEGRRRLERREEEEEENSNS